ncbi:hypothetical protein LCGC14_1983920 [marine sediment metagenome]|uniref:Uncharacterized protein n=1 Tax=marine sediment metagenome TaxID=412755 RepID=A0A0F9HLB5_9ZZZZ
MNELQTRIIDVGTGTSFSVVELPLKVPNGFAAKLEYFQIRRHNVGNVDSVQWWALHRGRYINQANINSTIEFARHNGWVAFLGIDLDYAGASGVRSSEVVLTFDLHHYDYRMVENPAIWMYDSSGSGLDQAVGIVAYTLVPASEDETNQILLWQGGY